MSKKGHVDGRKTVSSHGTVTDLVQKIHDFLAEIETVSKIIPGVITPISGRQSSIWTVKFQDQGSSVLVTATMKTTVQELRFYTSNKQKDTLALALWVKKHEWWLLIEKPIK